MKPQGQSVDEVTSPELRWWSPGEDPWQRSPFFLAAGSQAMRLLESAPAGWHRWLILYVG